MELIGRASVFDSINITRVDAMLLYINYPTQRTIATSSIKGERLIKKGLSGKLPRPSGICEDLEWEVSLRKGNNVRELNYIRNMGYYQASFGNLRL